MSAVATVTSFRAIHLGIVLVGVCVLRGEGQSVLEVCDLGVTSARVERVDHHLLRALDLTATERTTLAVRVLQHREFI
jgi:hypothetical protein